MDRFLAQLMARIFIFQLTVSFFVTGVWKVFCWPAVALSLKIAPPPYFKFGFVAVGSVTALSVPLDNRIISCGLRTSDLKYCLSLWLSETM